jgi:hypothetical protein
MRTVSQKMGIKECSRTILINAPAEVIADINLPGIENQNTMANPQCMYRDHRDNFITCTLKHEFQFKL